MTRLAAKIINLPQQRIARKGGGTIDGGICTGLALTLSKYVKIDNQGFANLLKDNPQGLLIEAKFLHKIGQDDSFSLFARSLEVNAPTPEQTHVMYNMTLSNYYSTLGVHCNLKVKQSKIFSYQATRGFQRKFQEYLISCTGYFQIALPNHTICAINKNDQFFVFYDPACGVALFRDANFMALSVAQYLCDTAYRQFCGLNNVPSYISVFVLE